MAAENDYDADEKKDLMIVRELMHKSSDYKELAGKLTEYFSKKYGSEFGGNVLFEYDLTDNSMTMTCYDQERVFDLCTTGEELLEIPGQLRMLRKSALRGKK